MSENKKSEDSMEESIDDNVIKEDDVLSQISSLLQEVYMESQNTHEHKQTQRVSSDIDTALVNVVSEFLDSFAIIGFNFNGEPIALTMANNQMKKEALASLVTKFVMILEQQQYEQ